ncbi:hypothetical protein JD844_017431 [Phrynosoma platyrhinos]|uniref:Sushi domain-containing protein n=1 Tax=Phrynosoma platyrhinos TaxID=52577 RepID=A0ABQ7SLX9_PHRPL|nr:hypothetical protein JD844_017431 [Phrynosoma platyrhinos]
MLTRKVIEAYHLDKGIECEAPFLEHGSIQLRKDQYVNRDVVKFYCGNGYTRVGPDAAQCYHFGCTPLFFPERVSSCQQPLNISNGILVGDLLEVYQHGEKMVYECDVRFAMAGSNTIECVDGEWTSLPSCTEEEKTCGPPPNILNGYPVSVDSNIYWHNETVKYACEKKFFIVGTNPARCLHGEWKLPECTKLCPPPPQLPNAINITEIRNYKNGEEVGFTCVEHFLLEGTPKISCEYGRWQTPPRCIDLSFVSSETCPMPTDESIIFSTTKPVALLEEKTLFECTDGYESISHTRGGQAVCTLNGWSPKPQCLLIECETPFLENGSIYPRKDQYVNRDVVKFSCMRGYIRVGLDSAQCYHFGWSPQIPSCKDVIQTYHAARSLYIFASK